MLNTYVVDEKLKVPFCIVHVWDVSSLNTTISRHCLNPAASPTSPWNSTNAELVPQTRRAPRALQTGFAQVDIDLVKLESQVMAEGSDEETETHTPSESVKETESPARNF